MAQSILHQILEQLEILELEKLKQLNQAIQRRLADQEEVKQSTFHEALLVSGLVKQIKEPTHSQKTEQQLIRIQGEPVSETIIQERR